MTVSRKKKKKVSCFPCADGFALKCEGHCHPAIHRRAPQHTGGWLEHIPFRELRLRAAGEITGLSNKVHDRYSPRFSPRIDSNTAQFGEVNKQKLLPLILRPEMEIRHVDMSPFALSLWLQACRLSEARAWPDAPCSSCLPKEAVLEGGCIIYQFGTW